MINNIFWDVDGTLFDTYPAITSTIYKSLSDLGVSIASNVIDGLARQSLEICFATFTRRFGLDNGVLKNLFDENYKRIPSSSQLPFANIKDVCNFIKEKNGINVIITHRGKDSTLDLLKAHQMESLFSEIYSSDLGYARKPDPEMVQAALARFDLNPSETLVVGDRIIDIQAGKTAGTPTCLFGNIKAEIEPDFRIENYEQLLVLLKREK